MSHQSRVALRNRLLTLVQDNFVLASNWGFYLQDPEFAEERELRNKLTAICLYGLLDTIRNNDKYLGEMVKKALDLRLVHGMPWISRMLEFDRIVRATMAKFSKGEQLVVTDLRNQFVHGGLENRYSSKISVAYFDGTRIVREQMSPPVYFSYINPVAAMHHDVLLDPIRERFLHHCPEYWAAIRQMLTPGYFEQAGASISRDLKIT